MIRIFSRTCSWYSIIFYIDEKSFSYSSNFAAKNIIEFYQIYNFGKWIFWFIKQRSVIIDRYWNTIFWPLGIAERLVYRCILNETIIIDIRRHFLEHFLPYKYVVWNLNRTILKYENQEWNIICITIMNYIYKYKIQNPIDFLLLRRYMTSSTRSYDIYWRYFVYRSCIQIC